MPGSSLSVVVVTYNSADALGPTLAALADELAGDDELIVVDNASSDGTPELVGSTSASATVLVNDTNTGFAAAANQGAAAACGDVLVLLNPDAVPAPGWAAAMRAGADGPYAAWMALVTTDGGSRINTSGGVVHATGIAWAGQAGAPVDEGRVDSQDVGFVSGACLAIRRDVWMQLGGFSPEFFMYHEDVDLSLRLRLLGLRTGVLPAARVDHDYVFHKGSHKWRALERNRWATLLRTYPGRLLLVLTPLLLFTELLLLAASAAGGWAPQKLAATADVARALPRLLRERRAIRATRVIGAREFADALVPELASAFLPGLVRSTPVSLALRAYWRIARALL